MSNGAAQLAELLLDHVRASAEVDFDKLAVEPRTALASDSSVRVAWVPAARLPRDCSIAATYDSATDPALITVAEDASIGRQRFSLLHEYAHHLIACKVFAVLEVLYEHPRAIALEEKVCDAFASFVLVPKSARSAAFVGGVTAEAVVGLMATSSASAQAVAVAAAECMDQPGYVVLLSRIGQLEFAARSGDVSPARRGAVQTGLLKTAALGAVVRGVTRLDLGGESFTPEMNVESAVAPTVVVAVLADGPVPWSRFSSGRSSWVEPHSGWCDDCSAEFTSHQRACQMCGERRCPHCGHCGCGPASVAGERRCDACYMLKGPALYSDARAVIWRNSQDLWMGVSRGLLLTSLLIMVGRSFDELAVGEGRAGPDERYEVGRVDGAPPGLG